MHPVAGIDRPGSRVSSVIRGLMTQMAAYHESLAVTQAVEAGTVGLRGN